MDKGGEHKVDWMATLHNIHGSIPFTCTRTSEMESRHRTYRIKAFQGLLPTAKEMQQRRPDLYTDAQCPMCGTSKEDNAHIWECTKAIGLRLDIAKEAKNIWTSLVDKETKYSISSEVAEMANQLFGVMVPLGSVFGVKDMSTI